MKKRGRTISLTLILIISLTFSLIPIYPNTDSYAEISMSTEETTTAELDFVVPVTPLTEVPVLIY